MFSKTAVICTGLVSDATIEEEDCENEEKEVEVCATKFLIYRKGSLPQSGPELDKFCRYLFFLFLQL